MKSSGRPCDVPNRYRKACDQLIRMVDDTLESTYDDGDLRGSCRYDVAFYMPWLTARLVADGAGRVQPGLGGAETQVILLSRALADRGLAVCMVVSDLPGVDVPASVEGVDVVVRPTPQGGTLRARLQEVAAARAAVRAANARVVICRGAGYSVGLVGFWTKLSRRRFVYSSAHVLDFDPKPFLVKRRDRLLFRLGIALTNKVVVQTEEQVELCKQRFRKTPILIRSVCEPAEQSEHEPEAFLWAGRADGIKQPLEYLDLARALPDARFRMVARAAGDSDSARLWNEIEHAARRLPNLELLPPCPRSELLELMARAVAVVSTSKSEGMPNIFLEGWACGIPALALNHDPDGIITRYQLGGCAQGEHDRLVELARELWNDRAARREFAARCRTYVQTRHSPQTVSTQWAEALRLTAQLPAQTEAIQVR